MILVKTMANESAKMKQEALDDVARYRKLWHDEMKQDARAIVPPISRDARLLRGAEREILLASGLHMLSSARRMRAGLGAPT